MANSIVYKHGYHDYTSVILLTENDYKKYKILLTENDYRKYKILLAENRYAVLWLNAYILN